MKTLAQDLAERDLKHIWHPCSQMKDYESLPPMVIDHAKGVYLYDTEGKRYLDIVGSWWCSLFGHANPTINDYIKAQVDKLEHVIFANFSHEPAINLTEELLPFLPPGLTKFHYNDNGSAAVECALKVAFQYMHQTGRPNKTKFMCFTESYHGETIGALSVGSLDLFAKMYQPMMMENIHVEAPDCFRCPYGCQRENCDCPCFKKAEEAFAKHAHETAAMIIEPLLQGCAGMRIYPEKYLQKLRKLCDEYDVLLIADEIATGFGRTGAMFACGKAKISPDIMCVSKGLTGGYLPMSIMITTEKIYDAFYGDWGEHKAFMHSHTYAGNPIGCAAARAVLHIFRTQPVFENMTVNAKWLDKRLHDVLGGHKNVGEIRHIGLIFAIELVADKEKKTPFNASRRIGYEIYKYGLKRGIVLRPLGDIIYYNPALNITQFELDEAVNLTKEAISAILG